MSIHANNLTLPVNHCCASSTFPFQNQLAVINLLNLLLARVKLNKFDDNDQCVFKIQNCSLMSVIKMSVSDRYSFNDSNEMFV